MAKSKSFLCIDLGAGSVKIAEFEPNDAGGLTLLKFAQHPLGLQGGQDAVREGAVKKALKSLLTEQGFSSKALNVCPPGYQVFSKFSKLPPVEARKVVEIIGLEAQNNIPFPIDEVVWDHQITGKAKGGELEVMLVAIKTDLVDKVFNAAESLGRTVDLVDTPQSALCNAFRHNYSELEGCSMVLDIGAKSSNVLFFEDGKVFTRSINIGANAITQEFATEQKMRFPDAEQFKLEQGFVGLGGAYEDPENPQQAAISKIARQVMTRLHIQVNQTIQFYKTQQSGSAPVRLFLAGGASIMPYTSQFFSEKLNIEVDYFNPFQSVGIDPSLDLEELGRLAPSFGTVVGLALRNVFECPVELNLMPRQLRDRQEFNRKKPLVLASVAGLVLLMLLVGFFFRQVAAEKQKVLAQLESDAAPLLRLQDSLRPEESALATRIDHAKRFAGLVEQRFVWSDLLAIIRQALMETEQDAQRQYAVDSGLWVESLRPDSPGVNLAGAAVVDTWEDEEEEPSMMMDIEMMKRYGLLPGGDSEDDDWGDEEETSVDDDETIIAKLTLACKGVNRTGINANANNNLAFSFLKKLQSHTNYFNADETKLVGELPLVDESDATFGFEISLRLKEPIPLTESGL